MREDGPRPQRTEVVEVGRRPFPVSLQAVLDLLLRLGEVNGQRQAPVEDQTAEPFECLGADRVHRVRSEARGYPRAELIDLIDRSEHIVL